MSHDSELGEEAYPPQGNRRKKSEDSPRGELREGPLLQRWFMVKHPWTNRCRKPFPPLELTGRRWGEGCFLGQQELGSGTSNSSGKDRSPQNCDGAEGGGCDLSSLCYSLICPCCPWTQPQIRGQGPQAAQFPEVRPLGHKAVKEGQRTDQEVVGLGRQQHERTSPRGKSGRRKADEAQRLHQRPPLVEDVLPEVKKCAINSLPPTALSTGLSVEGPSKRWTPSGGRCDKVLLAASTTYGSGFMSYTSCECTVSLESPEISPPFKPSNPIPHT